VKSAKKERRPLKPYHFNHHPLPPLAVKLRIEYLLPWPQVQLAVGDRNHHLKMGYKVLKVSIPVVFSRSMFFFLSVMGLAILPIGLLIKKRAFPVDSSKDPYWSYTATRRYFWLFLLSLVPFAFSFIVFIVFALIEVLLLGYVLSLCGLILVRPKEEDVR